ncbi:MAG: phosphatase PAP2 family protein [Deltaproteobacteria bacterium]|nr:phosphatase PAP2 family protein [Deltaproteobacteria bacterium]
MDLLRSWDRALFLLINNGLQSPMGDLLFGGFSTLGNSYVILPLSLAYLYLRNRKDRLSFLKLSFLFLLGIGLGALFVHLLKLLIERPRPLLYFADQMAQGQVRVHTLLSEMKDSHSFPSGHAQVAFGVATGLILLCRKHLFLLITTASLISFSRIYVGAHFPIDVIVGGLVGAVYTGITYRVSVILDPSRSLPSSPSLRSRVNSAKGSG